MTTDKVFHVYLLEYPDGTPYYVGKGSSKRIKHSRRNIFANNITRKLAREGYYILPRIVYSGTESRCLALEINLIAHYGRRDNSTGILTNLTDGGEGGSGTHWTPEKLKNLSDGIRRAGIRPSTEANRLAYERRKELAVLRGNWMTEEGRKSVSEANTGRVHGSDAREAVAAGQKQRREKEREAGFQLSFSHDAETRKRMSESHRARLNGNVFTEPTPEEYAAMDHKQKSKVARDRRRRDASPEKRALWSANQKKYREARKQKKLNVLHN